MEKVKISLVTIGRMPLGFDKKKIKNWQSSVFKLAGEIESFSLDIDSDGDDWGFTDASLEKIIPKKSKEDFLVALVNVPLQDNWYSRRLSNNNIILTFHEVRDILGFFNIPLENLVYRILYAYTLAYKSHGNRIPSVEEGLDLLHDEARGCLFDFNGNKMDVALSCEGATLCASCVEALKARRVSNEVIGTVQKEIKKIKKPFFYRAEEFIKAHLVWSFMAYALVSVALSLVSSYIFEFIKDKRITLFSDFLG